MKIAIYPGSFDPITFGHLNVLETGAQIFDKVIIAVSYNCNKNGFIKPQIRKELIEKSVSHLKNVEVDIFEGLTIEYAKKRISSQDAEEQKIKKSDFVIENNSDLQSLKKQVEIILEKLIQS